jgi:hypothetical protein
MGIENVKWEYYYPKKDYTRLKERLIRMNLGFTESISGVNRTLIHARVLYRSYFGDKVDTGMGFHLVSMVKRDIDVLFADKEVPVRNIDYKEQYFNIASLERFTGGIAIAIDITDCYWTVAFRLGYITERTYIMGKRKGKAWKIGRVASIGSLAKRKVTKYYENGEEIKERRLIESMPMKYQYARHNIIGKVYDMFSQLEKEVGNGFLMYLTDCVFIEPRNYRYAKKFFSDYGYQTKDSHCQILGVDKEKKVVHWFEFPKAKDKEGKEYVGGGNKYYQYSTNQCLFNVCDTKVDRKEIII